jgi:hypothetical protein
MIKVNDIVDYGSIECVVTCLNGDSVVLKKGKSIYKVRIKDIIKKPRN